MILFSISCLVASINKQSLVRATWVPK